MLIDDIIVIETTPCLADEGKFKALTKADNDMTEVFPYLNRVLDKAEYTSKTIAFKKGIVGFTLIEDQINLTKFVNNTELYELLDWVKDLINETYADMENIEPSFESRKAPTVLEVFKLLPKSNCRKCGETTCLAFADKLQKQKDTTDKCPEIADDAVRAKLTALLTF